MQLLSAFSRPQTVPVAPVSASRPKLWILDSWRDLILYVGTPLLLVVCFVCVWDGRMQTYGFCRIYDAKAGTFDTLTRRLDFAMCVIWFATAVALSPYRLSDTLDTYYMCGGPFIPPSVVQLGQG